MRYWTQEEAQAYLPRVVHLLDVLAVTVETANRAKGNGHRKDVDVGLATREVDAATAAEELHEQGVVVRDIHAGLIDFPARGDDGVDYLICWRRDDGDLLGWWHYPDEGFMGRKPLPRRAGH